MFVSYPAVFLKNVESLGFTILFPDLPGCISCGNDVKDALYMANDALGCFYLMIMQGLRICQNLHY